MNTEWRQLLERDGAVFDDEQVLSFGDEVGERRAARENLILADLSAWGFIGVSGADAEVFLQGQLANDVKALSPELSQLSAYCSPKGRILASLRVIRREDEYLLRLPQATLEATLKRLRMFVLRSKVTLEDRSDEFLSLGLAGEDAAERLGGVLSDLPAEPNAVSTAQDVTVVRVAGHTTRYECYGRPESIIALWQQLGAGAAKVSSATWAWLDIIAGVPWVAAETVDAFVPQMLNLQAIGALSFTKGCYPGQEIVARTQYLGKLKRRMFLAHADVARCPAPGTDVFAATDPTEQSAGKVVDAQLSPDGGVDLLVVIQLAAAEGGGPLTLASPGGSPLTLAELPYPVETQAPPP